mmetsp:Transcript_47459/g.60945  ORF Transcript_47459/g.60945 Transcript_47459/m.60945 type:complete len:96 (-) Transcript_47459:226-513(-)
MFIVNGGCCNPNAFFPIGGACLFVLCICLAYFLGPFGALSFLLCIPYGYFWYRDLQRQREEQGFRTQRTGLGVPVNEDAQVHTVVVTATALPVKS